MPHVKDLGFRVIVPSMLTATATAALRRFLKFVLKRSIGPYLQTELDLSQLDVELSTGKLELHNVLLNCDAINTALVRACKEYFCTPLTGSLA